MPGVESNTVAQESAGYPLSATQSQQGRASAPITEPMRRYLNDPTYSVAALGVGGPSRAGSDRAGEYSTLFASISSLTSQGCKSNTAGTKQA